MMIDFEDHSEEYREAFLAYLDGNNSYSRLTWRDWLAVAASSAYLTLAAAAVYFFCMC